MNKFILVIVFIINSITVISQNELIFFGSDAVEVSSYSSIPSINVNTHFGEVEIGETKTLTFTVTNNYHGFFAGLGLTLGTPQITGLDASEFSVSNPVIGHLAENESTTFSISINPTASGIKDATISFTPYLWIFPLSINSFNIRGTTDTPVISVFDNSNTRLISNATPNTSSGTDFGVINLGGSSQQFFQIRNEGSETLNLDSENLNKNESMTGEFLYNLQFPLPAQILPGQLVEFNVEYQPKDVISDSFTISYNSNDPETNPYIINFQGNGLQASAPDIMITQYYENGNNNDFIEIKNISNTIIPGNTYFLAYYRRNRNLSSTPNRNVAISEMNPGEVRVYNNFSIRGNDLVLISTTNNSASYANRVDIIGEQGTSWGSNRSFTKGGCANENPNVDFDINDWIGLDISKVNNADSRQNIALGTYTMGPISWNGTFWSDNGLPDLSRLTTIDGPYLASQGNIEACDIAINDDLNFSGNTTNSVIVYRDMNINGTFTLGDHASLVMYDNNASIVGDITKNEYSTYRNNAFDFTYWSSPIENANISTVFNGVTPSRIYLFDQSQSSSTDPNDPTYWNTWIIASGIMNPGSGYGTEGVTGTIGKHFVSFNGKPNNGIILVNVFENNDASIENDFNLIGNPYPSAIDIEAFFDLNITMIDPTVYLWTHQTPVSNGTSGDFSEEDYATYNYTGGTGVGGPIPDKNMGSSQGFFIRALNSGFVEFNNSMRMENANDQFFKSSIVKNKSKSLIEKDRIWLNLITDKGGFNQLLIGFMENATEEFDSGYDAVKLDGGNSIGFYSTIENNKYAIQGLPRFSPEQSVNLGYDSNVAPRSFTVSIDKTEGKLRGSDVFIVDKKLNITHNLKESDYQFKVEEIGEHPNRFTLQFQNSAVLAEEEFELTKNEFIISQNNGLNINSQEIVKSVIIYDILGRKIISDKPQKRFFTLNTDQIQKGTVLIIEANLIDNKTITNKIIKI